MFRLKSLYIFLIIFLVLLILGCETEEIETSELNNATETVERTENLVDEKTPEEDLAKLPKETIDNEPTEEENEAVAVEENTTQEEAENETEAYTNYHYMRYGNTSGNIANGGYVAYDQDTKKHILSRNQGVYFFDPEKNIMEEIFSIEASGSAEYINTSENWIYYINSDNGSVIRRSKEDYSITETIYDGKATYLDNYNIYLYFLAQEEIPRFCYFKESKEKIKKTNTNQVSMMSSFGTNIFYYKNTSSDPSAYRVSDLYCGEKTTLVKFDKDFISIESVLAYGEFSNAMIVEKEGVSGFYLYDGGNLLHSITSDDGIQGFSSINYDGNYFYFIGEKNENRLLFKLDPETYELREYVSVPADGSRLSIINNWMYLKKMGTNKIYQLAPDTEQFKLLDE